MGQHGKFLARSFDLVARGTTANQTDGSGSALCSSERAAKLGVPFFHATQSCQAPRSSMKSTQVKKGWQPFGGKGIRLAIIWALTLVASAAWAAPATGWSRALGSAFALQAESQQVESQQVESPGPDIKTAPDFDDAFLFACFDRLESDEQQELIEWFRLEAGGLQTYQAQLLRTVLPLADTDPGLWEERSPARAFGSSSRPRLAGADARRQELLQQVHGDAADRRLDRAWIYDPGSGELRVVRDDRRDWRVIRDALQGALPDEDYAEALIERILDKKLRANDRPALDRLRADWTAFARLYGDGDALVEGLNLFAALGAAEPLPLTDIDRRGLIDALSLSPSAGMEEILARHENLRRERDLRHYLARIYFEATPELPAQLEGKVMQLHGLWVRSQNNPLQLELKLPAAGEQPDFWTQWEALYARSSLLGEVENRRRALSVGRRPVRLLMVRLMREFGAFEPKPVQAAPSEGGGPIANAAPEGPSFKPFLKAERESILAAVAKLGGRDRLQLIADLEQRIASTKAPQVDLVAELIQGQLGTKFKQPSRFEAHDAGVYGGGPKRRNIKAGHRLWDGIAEQLEQRSQSDEEYRYEFATGQVVAMGASRSERILQRMANMLRGLPPDVDLARAQLLKRLDRAGVIRAESKFFAHLYSDRDGNAYEGITLFDVWANEVPLEVPDVDALAYAWLVHGNEDLRPPLNQADHQRWYPRMADSLKLTRDFSWSLEALAKVWFEGEPVLGRGYDPSLVILHSLAARASNAPERLAQRIERDKAQLLSNMRKEIKAMGDSGWDPGRRRRDEMRAGQARILEAVRAVLAEKDLL